jgi:hypothetical protein
MAAVTAIAIAGLAISAAGTFASIQAQKKAGKAQRKLAEAGSRRDRRRAIREARIARATTLNVGAQVGAGDSSSVAGGISSTGAQLGSNLGFSTNTQALGNRISKLNQKASMFSGIGSVGAGIFNLASSFPASAPSPQPSAFTGGLGGTGVKGGF